MPAIIILVLGFLLALFLVWPNSWLIGIAALVLILVGAFKVMVAR